MKNKTQTDGKTLTVSNGVTEMPKPYDKRNWEKAKQKGRCSPWQYQRFASFGWDMTGIVGKTVSMKKSKKINYNAKADYELDIAYGSA